MASRENCITSIPDELVEKRRIEVKKGDHLDHSMEVVGVACPFLACRQGGGPRTFKEVSTAARIPKKDFRKVFKKFIKSLVTNASSVCVEDLLSHFCSSLNLDVSVQRLMANHAATRALNLTLDGGRSPLLAAAAAIFMVARACGVKKKKEIGDSAGVAYGWPPSLPLTLSRPPDGVAVCNPKVTRAVGFTIETDSLKRWARKSLYLGSDTVNFISRPAYHDDDVYEEEDDSSILSK